MLGNRFLMKAVFRGVLCFFIAAFLLSFLAIWFLPASLMDPVYGDRTWNTLLGIGIWLASAGLGILEGLGSWKEYTKENKLIEMSEANLTDNRKSFGFVLERFKKNCRGFWGAYHWLIILFVISLIADGGSTIYCMLRAGPEVELHPAIYIVARTLGPIAGPLCSVVAKTVAGIMVAVYCRRFAGYIFVAGAIISFWAAWYNVTYSS
jgi:hypothetical protein